MAQRAKAYKVPKFKQQYENFIGDYKKSGFGRKNHKMMLYHYRQDKNMLVSYDMKVLGFF